MHTDILAHWLLPRRPVPPWWTVLSPDLLLCSPCRGKGQLGFLPQGSPQARLIDECAKPAPLLEDGVMFFFLTSNTLFIPTTILQFTINNWLSSNSFNNDTNSPESDSRLKGSVLQDCPYFRGQLQMGCLGHPHFCLASYKKRGCHDPLRLTVC